MLRPNLLARRTPLRRGKALRARKDPLKAYCWTMLRELVLHRDGHRCRWCGRRPPEVVLQAAHIKSRGAHPSLAWHLDNVLSLCLRCHLYRWHKEPQEAAAWAAKNLPPAVLAKLDLAARMNGRRGGSHLALVRIALEQDMKRAGLPLPPAPTIIPLPKAKRRAE